MNGGKRVSRLKNSGFGRSGAVHVRKYPSESQKSRFGFCWGACAKRSSTSASGVVGVTGSSAADEPEVER